MTHQPAIIIRGEEKRVTTPFDIRKKDRSCRAGILSVQDADPSIRSAGDNEILLRGFLKHRAIISNTNANPLASRGGIEEFVDYLEFIQ